MTATKQKDLRTGAPVWSACRTPRVPARKLARSRRTDVLVVGAGITGAMIGHALAAAGRDVTFVDRRPPTRGSTAASTALVQYEIDTPLTVLSRKIGKTRAIRVWRRSRLAVTALAAELETLGIPMQRRNALYLAGNTLNAKALEREAKARLAAGLTTRVLSRGELKEEFGMARDAALLGYDNIAVNPVQMTAGFLDAATAHGAEIYSPVEIVDVEAKRNEVVAIAASGHEIRARTLIFATGYEIPKRVPTRATRSSRPGRSRRRRRKANCGRRNAISGKRPTLTFICARHRTGA